MAKPQFPAKLFLVERFLPGLSQEELTWAQQAAIDASRDLSASGNPVRFLRSIFVPGEARCICLFEAQAASIVQLVNEVAVIPFVRIVEAIDLSPGTIGAG